MGLFLRAQVVVPSDVYQWDGEAGDNIWHEGANWYHPSDDNTVPPEDAAVFFGAMPGTTAFDRIEIKGELVGIYEGQRRDIGVGSLWFDVSEEGAGLTISTLWDIGYTGYEGADLTLGMGMSFGGDLISVRGWEWSRETRILAGEIIIDDLFGDAGSRSLGITNESRGGLLINARNLEFDFGDTLAIRGGGITHIASDIGSDGLSGAIDVQGHRTQLVLSPYSWLLLRQLSLSDHGIAVIKKESLREVVVNPTGTLMLRDRGWGDLLSSYTLKVAGEGAARGRNLVKGGPDDLRGAIYNDGGENGIGTDIEGFGEGDIWFASREGNLSLRGNVDLGESRAFVKDGEGTITLSGDGNTWREMRILAGELRVDRESALTGGFGVSAADAPALHFAGYGLSAVLGWSESLHAGFTRKVGREAGSVYWTGNGGFFFHGSSWDDDRAIALTNRNDEQGGLLHWHRDGFMGAMGEYGDHSGRQQLLLGSEVPISPGSSVEGYQLVWKNAIDLGDYAQFQSELEALESGAVYSRERVVNVLDGVAEMQGALSGTGFDLVKEGGGMLWLTSSESNYDGATIIRGGALRGVADNLDFTNIVLAGGVYMLEGAYDSDKVYNLKLGTGAGEFSWAAQTGGGFASSGNWGETATIRIGDDPAAALAWGAEHFVRSGQELIFGYHLSSRSPLIWDKALDLGSASQTIRVVAGTAKQYGPGGDYNGDVQFSQGISGLTGLALNVVGDGFLGLGKANSLSRLNLTGATVILSKGGTLIDTDIYISEGGQLVLRSGVEGQPSRLGTGGLVDLGGGASLIYEASEYDPDTGDSRTQASADFGRLRLSGGANFIDGGYNETSVMRFKELERADDRTTLDLGSAYGSPETVLEFTTANVDYAEFDNFLPWVTVNGSEWAVADGGTGQWQRLAEAGYNTGAPSTWTSSSHVKWEQWGELDQSRTIRSLILNDRLTVDGHTLTVGSGGIIFGYSGVIYRDAYSTSVGSALTTGASASGGLHPLYAHVGGSLHHRHASNGGYYGEGAVISVDLIGGMDFVKSGIGTLKLWGAGSSNVGSVYVHAGRLELDLGPNASLHVAGRIVVGDRAGQDVLRLPRYSYQLKGRPDVLLRGSHGNGEGILEFAFNKNTDYERLFVMDGAGAAHRFNKLEVENYGVIDFRGGQAGIANFLYLEELVIDLNSRLSIRSWFEGEDYLLVRNTAANRAYIENDVLNINNGQRIVFEGYGPLYTRYYDVDYFEITPFNHLGIDNDCPECPEPSTYGALLGTLGLAVAVWRKRQKGRRNAGFAQ